VDTISLVITGLKIVEKEKSTTIIGFNLAISPKFLKSREYGLDTKRKLA